MEPSGAVALLQLKLRHQAKLMQVQDMQAVDFSLLFRIVALAGKYIIVQHAVGEAQLVLIAHAAEAVRRGLSDQLLRQTEQ